MPVYAIDDRVPSIDAEAFVHPEATIIGRRPRRTPIKHLAQRGATRQYETIVIGQATSVQDNFSRLR
jgi:carbonic anhydrase/acetyltransferase-like protein (isoleucine patch superfamily)